MQRFADAVQQSGVDIVPRVLIKGGADGDSSTGSVIEGLMAMLLSDKLGVNVADQAARSPEADALRQQIRESMSKPASGESAAPSKPDAKKK